MTSRLRVERIMRDLGCVGIVEGAVMVACSVKVRGMMESRREEMQAIEIDSGIGMRVGSNVSSLALSFSMRNRGLSINVAAAGRLGDDVRQIASVCRTVPPHSDPLPRKARGEGEFGVPPNR